MNTQNDAPASSFQQASQWEASRVLSAERSERRAWLVAGVFAIGFVMAAGAIMMMMPLKQITAQFYRIDNATGSIEMFTTLADEMVTDDEVMNEYWLARFVLHYETYNWHTLNTDYRTIGLMAAPDVAAEYVARFEGERALDKVYADKVKQTVNVINVVPSGFNTAAVRFTLTTTNVRTGSIKDSTRYLATMAFEYTGEERTSKGVRLVNPKGFTVTSYRADEELAGDS